MTVEFAKKNSNFFGLRFRLEDPYECLSFIQKEHSELIDGLKTVSKES